MKPVLLSQVAAWCQGRLVGDDVEIARIGTDSRIGLAHTLFVALRGERHDAHQFAAQAEQHGAAALLLQRPVDTGLPYVLCADTQEALAEIAAGLAAERRTVVLALTGSNGKTTVKTLLHAIMRHAGRTYANPGNFNNEIGLPLAVIETPEDSEFAIYEMGAGKPGDIAYLCSVVGPNVALVNNIAPAHVERMGSLQGIAETKGAIYEALPDDGVAVLNADDAFAGYFLGRIGVRPVLRFGLDGAADVSAHALDLLAESTRFELRTPAGNAPVTLAFAGRHNVRNALAAVAMALAAGAPFEAVVKGLHEARPVAGRQDPKRLPDGTVLIDDSYNANPGSVAAAIDALAAACALDGRTSLLVLGDMAELGDAAEALHAEIGRRAKAAGLAQLWTCGRLSRAAAAAFGPDARHFDDRQSLLAALPSALDGSQRVLVKGSRSSAMDAVVNALLGQPIAKENTHAA